VLEVSEAFQLGGCSGAILEVKRPGILYLLAESIIVAAATLTIDVQLVKSGVGARLRLEVTGLSWAVEAPLGVSKQYPTRAGNTGKNPCPI
jgi:hypothetical protein